MKSLVILGLVAAGAILSLAQDGDWETHKKTYGLNYKDSAEDSKRKNIFQSNLKMIKEHNKRYDQGKESYQLGVNQLTQFEPHEVATGFKTGPEPQLGDATPFEMPDGVVPDSKDWRDSGAVTAVKNQGDCNSCFAWSAAGAIESALFIKNGGPLIELSKSNIVDCTMNTLTKYDCEGCAGGGWMTESFQYILDVQGLMSEAAYPYVAQTRQCRFDASRVAAKLSGYVNIPEGDENAVKAVVGLIGPVTTVIGVNNTRFGNYKRGLFRSHCDPNSYPHAMLIVGYGTDPKTRKDYWIVKNSWGTNWGIDGYIWIPRYTDGQKNQFSCTIAYKTSYPIIAD